MRRLLIIVALLPSVAFAQRTTEEERRWNAPVAPFRIIGNLYYVGAAEVSSYLIATPKGHIVIDAGFEETAPKVLENVAKLGFDVHDIRILLNTHAHYDHAAGFAALKDATGAALMVSEGDAPQLVAGGKGEPQFGDRFTFPPVTPDRLLRDGDKVSLGGTILTNQIASHVGGRESGVGFNAIPSRPPTPHPRHPTFTILKSLPCDIPLAPHGSFFDLLGKMRRLRKGERPNPFIDGAGYKAYVTRAEAAFERALRKGGQ